MESDKYNDRLEEIFSQQLNSNEFEPAAWNTPSERNWDAIAASLPEPKRNRRLLFMLFLIFGFMIAFLLFGYQLFEDDSVTEATHEKEEVTLEQRNKGLQSTLVVEQRNEQEKSKLSTSTSRLQEIPTKEATNTSSTSTIDNGLAVAINVAADTAEEVRVEIEVFNKPNKIADSETATQIREIIPETLVQKDFEGFASLRSERQINLEKEEVMELPASKKVIVDASLKWNAEAHFGALLSTQSFQLQQGATKLDILPTSSLSAGLNVEHTLHKNWIVGSGIHYQQSRFQADYEVHFNYAAVGEIQTNEGFAKTYTHSLPSLLNQIDADIVLMRSTGEDIAAGSDIPVDIALAHGMELLQVPLYVKYIQHTGNWSYYLKTGIFANFLTQTLSTEHRSTTAQHTAMHYHSSSFQAAEGTSIRKRDLAYRLFGALGVQYQKGTNWYFFAEPTFTRALTNHYKNKAVSENQSNFGIGVGIGRRF
ncbi:MAG: hypothetical protein AAF849_18070 [Bacteroidota bacterium]